MLCKSITSMRRFFLCFTILISLQAFSFEISIINEKAFNESEIVRLALEDVKQLLKEATGEAVNFENQDAEVLIYLPKNIEDKSFIEPVVKGSKNLSYPESAYEWVSTFKDGKFHLHLKAKTYQAIANGMYGLLQEALGFQFYHPRETIVPKLKSWPLEEDFKLIAEDRFNVRGFHLHTMHPLELTEALLDHNFPNGIAQVKEYIDWLARNGQNYLDFNLLETIDEKKWIEHAKQIVDYCHDRGVIAGIDISLHMIQQKAFMLYKSPPASFRSKRKQVEKSLEWLFLADWDVVNMEFSTTEFSQGNLKEKEELRAFITELITEKYHAKLVGREHVVKPEEMVDGTDAEAWEQFRSPKDSLRGLLVHTVMFYSLKDEVAKVYGNENLQHMFDILLKEMKHRETWYYPETAYWITFDNSVPMFLMPYLNARLEDIMLCDSINVPGHITFSSGWEWGYWLFDWSIARWSWKYAYTEGVWEKPTATQFLNDIFPEEDIQEYFSNHLNLQQRYLKDQELMQYMTAMTVTDEMIGPVNLELHPRPDWSYKSIRNKVSGNVLDTIEDKWIPMLNAFYDRSKAMNDMMAKNESLNKLSDQQSHIFNELNDGLKITADRAWHRSHTLRYLIGYRRSKINGDPFKNGGKLLGKAESIRIQAIDIVRQREQNYRYDLILLNSKRKGHTAYHFGYLYPVRDLHFWHREEMQAKTGKYGAFYRIIWNVPRIIGLW